MTNGTKKPGRSGGGEKNLISQWTVVVVGTIRFWLFWIARLTRNLPS